MVGNIPSLKLDGNETKGMFSTLQVHTLLRQLRKGTDNIKVENRAWWTSNKGLFPNTNGSFPIPSSTFLTERILPLQKETRDTLIDVYCPSNLKESVRANPTNRDCLARLYLGRRGPENIPLASNFTLRNFDIYVDQMSELRLPFHLWKGLWTKSFGRYIEMHISKWQNTSFTGRTLLPGSLGNDASRRVGLTKVARTPTAFVKLCRMDRLLSTTTPI
jgi:hypothetical protein